MTSVKLEVNETWTGEIPDALMMEALDENDGNITRTARTLGLSRLGLRKKMQRYGLNKVAEGV